MTTTKTVDIAEQTINTIRFLAVDAVEKANSGHPGMPMGMASAAYTLWKDFLKHNPKNPAWANRDRFILSNGHGSMLLYSLLHLTGYDMSLDDLKNFRQFHSKTPGHPEYGDAPGIETTTGPLGQGFATAVGMAIAQKYLNGLFTPSGAPLLDHHIYVFAGDGCMMEGVTSEAASLAGHLGLGKIIVIYDDNHISIDGSTDLTFSEDVKKRFESYHWHVQSVSDGNDRTAFAAALRTAQSETSKPSIIALRTQIGFGSPNKANNSEAHGSPLGPEETKLTKQNLGWPLEPAFYVPEEAKAWASEALANGAKWETEWTAKWKTWANQNPDGAKLWNRLVDKKLPDGWEKQLPIFDKEEKLATRAASGKVIGALATVLPELIGGSADLTPSNNTFAKGMADFTKTNSGRYIRFGVREHAMASALNGMALSQMLIPYGGTFFNFLDYMKGGVRLSALMKQKVIYVLTHDSIGLGEDGPTHQPVEHLAHLRAMPNTITIRPADANETVAAWKFALETKSNGPINLILSRQNLPVLLKSKYPLAGSVEKGAYVLSEAKGGTAKVLLIATGSEVSLALTAQEKLEKDGVPTRVVSMPSWEIFSAQTESYRQSVLPKEIKARVSIEALATFGWERWVGFEGATIGLDHFGASAPATVLFEKFGITADAVAAKAKTLL